VARATGQGARFPVLTVLLGAVTLMAGRPGEAAALLEGAVEAARLSGNDQSLALHLLNQAQAVLAEGDVGAAIALAEESVALGRELDDSLLGHWAAEALAAALLEAREPERAVALLLGAAGGEDLSAIPSGFRVNALELLVRCLLALGRREDATRVARHAMDAAAALGLGVARCMAHRAASAVALDAGDAAAAVEHAHAAAAAADAAGVPLDAARSRLLAGRALAMAGRREAAVQELERAAAGLQACGALRWRDEAERELRRLGRRIHRRSRPAEADAVGVASLTARELEVGRLVVDRRTNAEIAATLFLSRKTIETHLRNIFFKLGVSARADVARAIEQADEA
jgi:DNA-binding CsgD family transcriptional regulator